MTHPTDFSHLLTITVALCLVSYGSKIQIVRRILRRALRFGSRAPLTNKNSSFFYFQNCTDDFSFQFLKFLFSSRFLLVKGPNKVHFFYHCSPPLCDARCFICASETFLLVFWLSRLCFLTDFVNQKFYGLTKLCSFR